VFVLVATTAYAHPGGLDPQGGHRDRKSGGYHYHGGGGGAGRGSGSTHVSVPQPLYRTEAREDFRRESRSSTLLTARKLPPKASGFGSTSSEESSAPEYDVKERGSSSIGERVKIAFRSDSPQANKQHLEAIAAKEARVPYAVFYFLPGMDFKKPPWASCTHRRGNEKQLHIFDERAPKGPAGR
jgi:hypothetical protein